MKVLRKIIEIDEELCDGCGQCVPSCAEGSLQIVDGKAKMVSDNLCDGLGACLGECPNDALKIVEREADEFDEEAVEKHLAEKEAQKQKEPLTLACGCPSTKIQAFEPTSSCKEANIPGSLEGEDSALSHWPIQIKLVPATAPFLKGADLLVLADCCGIAFPTLHRDLLKGRVIMIGLSSAPYCWEAIPGRDGGGGRYRPSCGTHFSHHRVARETGRRDCACQPAGGRCSCR